MFSLSPHVFIFFKYYKNIFSLNFKIIKPKYSGYPISPNVFMFSLSPHVFIFFKYYKNIFSLNFKIIKPKYSGYPIFPNVFMFSLSPHVFIFFKYYVFLLFIIGMLSTNPSCNVSTITRTCFLIFINICSSFDPW